jgi:asparagine synthase (glutamine-hydrolysing)
MCGIATALGVRDARRVAAAMGRSLAHRGPDDAGCLALRGPAGDEAGAMAHRRLSILDLTAAGHQPMVSADERFTIAFNGEIYNFRALRAELERAGARFASQGDTAVLLEGWARFGPAFAQRLEGMFAFALWDAAEAALYLVRDAFGIKPLYYARVGAGLLAASEVRALLASGLVPPLADRCAVAGYLTFGSVPEPETIIAGVRMVPAGTVLRMAVRQGELREERVAAIVPLALTDGAPIRGRADAARAVRAALERSLDRHLVSDVPVAVFLSGGLDSSAVAALAAARAGTRLDAFTVTFAERRFDESAVARLVAARYGFHHHEIPLGGTDLLAALPAAFAAMDQPSLDGINTYVVSAAVRAHGTKVVLSGLGGDELFAGYPSFRRARALARYARLPAPARTIVARMATRVGGVRGAKVALGLRRGSPADAAYLASRTLFGDRQVADLCGARHSAPSLEPSGLTLLQRVSWNELTGYMRNTLLRDSDVFSMAHGLELRVPFLDREVAEAAFRCADALKLSRGLARGTAKPLLVDAVRDLLPPDVWDRPKQGFVLPFADWMRGPLAAEVGAALGDADRLHSLGIAPRAACDVWTAFSRGQAGVTWSRPWALYSLVRWADAVGVTASSVPEGAPANAPEDALAAGLPEGLAP